MKNWKWLLLVGIFALLTITTSCASGIKKESAQIDCTEQNYSDNISSYAINGVEVDRKCVRDDGSTEIQLDSVSFHNNTNVEKQVSILFDDNQSSKEYIFDLSPKQKSLKSISWFSKSPLSTFHITVYSTKK